MAESTINGLIHYGEYLIQSLESLLPRTNPLACRRDSLEDDADSGYALDYHQHDYQLD